MEEILEAYRQVREGIMNQEIFTYKGMNLHFANNTLNIYDSQGEMPFGRYRLPMSEEKLQEKLEELDEKVQKMMDNNQFACGKCGEASDLPEYTRSKYGDLICENCANGGDIRKNKAPIIKTDGKREIVVDPNVPSTVQKTPIDTESAIALLRNQGYIVKKLKKSFQVVFKDKSGGTHVSDQYYKSKEDFENKHPQTDKKFITMVRELYETEEESL